MNTLNAKMFSFSEITPIPNEIIAKSRLQKSMIFELSMARAESQLQGGVLSSWSVCLAAASKRQQYYFDSKIPNDLEPDDIIVADHAARNLVTMLTIVRERLPEVNLESAPLIQGMGWVASGRGDFSLGSILIEVKHTDRNFGANDFRQVLMYWLLRYASIVENDGDVWSDVLLLNPRRNAALFVNYDYLLRSASASSDRVELVEMLRSAVAQEFERR